MWGFAGSAGLEGMRVWPMGMHVRRAGVCARTTPLQRAIGFKHTASLSPACCADRSVPDSNELGYKIMPAHTRRWWRRWWGGTATSGAARA